LTVIEVRHTGIVVTDLERSLHFYRDLLGLRVVRSMQEAGAYLDNMLGLKDVQVTTVKLAAGSAPTLVELLKFTSHVEAQSMRTAYTPGPTHIAFTVEDLDLVYANLTRNGVRFNAPPQLSPDGYAKVTFCHDPDGALIELVQVMIA
jgi:catechol 2,3-dioxygenase-like lactoylglutathione lyase family enzyme